METTDVIDRLKRVTPDGVATPTLRSRTDGLATSRLTGCRNCGEDAPGAGVEPRQLVAAEPDRERNRIPLCEDCHDHTAVQSGENQPTKHHSARSCATAGYPVDAAAIRERDDHRCRGCDVRERIVVGDDLHVHPVVPIGTGGFRHPHNFVALCPTCHRKLHD